MAYLLTAFGHEVVAAHDGKAGVECFAGAGADLVICDVHLPRMDGYQVVSVLKEKPESRGIPVIAVTALAMVGDRDRLLASGFDGYISKPIDPQMFVQQIEAFLSAREPGS